MKSREMMKAVLSGVALIGSLSLFISEGFASSDVYLIRPDSAANSGWANTVWESFSATCDSIDSVSFFVGAEVPHKIYTAQVYDSVTQQVVWSTTRSSTGWKYQDMGFGVRKPVVRGKKYCLQLSIADSSFLPLQWNYYYRNGNPYAWGVMGGYGGGKDLSARVAGTNRIPQTFIGVNTYFGVSPWLSQSKVDSLMTKLDSAGMKISREQIPWYFIQGDFGSPNAYSWDSTDRAVSAARSKGIPLLISIDRTPKWASSYNDSLYADSIDRWHSAPPKNLDTAYDSRVNYFYNLMCSLATRYAPQGVHDWEIGNEVNLLNYWDFWWEGRYYPNPPYPRTHSGRAKLYKRACQVAWEAIKGIDPQARIFTNGVVFLNIGGASASGKQWLRDFYDHGGKSYTDVITYHFYPEDTVWAHRFRPWKFQADYDTVRAILQEKDDRTRPVWADEGGWGTSTTDNSTHNVGLLKQADVLVQAFNAGIGQLTNPRGPLDNVSWYSGFNFAGSTEACWKNCGVLEFPNNGVAYKQSGYAFKQMTGKLKDKYFNRRVPLADTNAYCYEFQTTDTGLAARKTWVVWRAVPKQPSDPWDSLPCRTNKAYYDSTYYSSSGSPRVDLSYLPYMQPNGKVAVPVDTVPIYVSESLAVSRPDVIVDSLYTYPSNPKAGEGVYIYARIKNIGYAALAESLGNAVTFQVDGVSKKTYTDQRGLGVGDTLTIGYFTGLGIADWVATWGDHLIRAWADSSDRYVELREDNNCGYLFKHISPKVSVLINNGNKFTNHFSNDTLNLAFNGGTSPQPDSMRVKNEGQWGSWIKPPVTTYVFNFDAGNGNGPRWDSVEIRQSGEADIGGDSIIVDASSPFVDITSPTQGQTVSGNVPFWGWSWDYEDHDFLWEIYVNGSPWVSGNNKVGENPMFGMPGQFGTWDSRTVPNGWRWHQLWSTDAATNLAKDSVKVKVSNHQTNSGDSWASNFGTLLSAPMNVATDPAGNVYFAETQNSKIRKYSQRKDSLFAFSARRGDSTGLNWAVGMAMKDSTTIYIADGYNHCVKAFDRQGNLLLRFGSFGQEPGQFRQPCGIALDHKGRLFVVDRLNNRVQVFSDSSGGFLFQFGSQGQDSGKFNSPTGIAYASRDTALGLTQDLIYISDTRNNQLQVFDSLGNYLKTIKKPDSLGFDTPTGICADKWGDVYIADTKHNRIVELNPYGERILDFGGLGDSLWQFRTPIGVASSPGAHYLYVADAGNRRVQKFVVIEEDTTGGGPQGGAVVQLPPVNFLGPARPNPTTGEAFIAYGLAKESPVSLVIYNVTGQVVKEFNQGKQKAWYYSIQWDGRSNLGHRVGAGVYFYRLQAGNWAKTRKMVVIR